MNMLCRFEELDKRMNGLDYPFVAEQYAIEPYEIAKYIDYSLLKPNMTSQQIIDGCKEAIHYKCLTVAVMAANVPLAYEVLKGSGTLVKVGAGFPHGNTATQVKAFEAACSVAAGVCEVDMVMNIGRFRGGEFDYVEREIRMLAEITHAAGTYLHVILETAYLTPEEIVGASRLVEQAGADVVKTSTGFASTGATIPNLKLIKESISPTMLVKAASGVRNLDQALAVISCGCCRFGCTATSKIMEDAFRRAANKELFVLAAADIPDDCIAW